MSTDEFSVFEFLPDGTSICVGRNLDARAAVGRAERSTRKPAASLDIIKRVIVTDAGDFTVFEWKNGQGVTWPPRWKS